MAKSQKKKLKIFTAVACMIVFAGLLFFLFSGDNYKILQDMFREDLDRDELQDSLSALGYKGYITFGLLSMLQVVFTFLPAEPAQVLAGISFGFVKGVGICLTGVFVGNSIIFLLYRLYGDKMEEYFTKNAEFDFEAARSSPKIAIVAVHNYQVIVFVIVCFRHLNRTVVAAWNSNLL